MWNNVVISPDLTVREGMRLLEDFPLQILLIVNQENELIGCLTDGDIRRAMLDGFSLDTPVQSIMFKKPICVQEGSSDEMIQKIFKDQGVSHVPLLRHKKLVGLKTMKDYFLPTHNTKLSPVLIMAGGFGKRLRPLTEDMPKPMVPLNGKPILEHLILQLYYQGFNQIIISTYYRSDAIINYFKNGEKFGVNITYLHENEPLGTAGAINLLGPEVDTKNLIIMNGDVVSNINLQQMYHFHCSNPSSSVTVAAKQHHFSIDYGVIEHDQFHITSIKEKPIIDQFISAGIYIIDSDMRSLAKSLTKFDMPDLINLALKSGHQAMIFPVVNYWKDVGTLNDFNAAELKLKEHSE